MVLNTKLRVCFRCMRCVCVCRVGVDCGRLNTHFMCGRRSMRRREAALARGVGVGDDERRGGSSTSDTRGARGVPYASTRTPELPRAASWGAGPLFFFSLWVRCARMSVRLYGMCAVCRASARVPVRLMV